MLISVFHKILLLVAIHKLFGNLKIPSNNAWSIIALILSQKNESWIDAVYNWWLGINNYQWHKILIILKITELYNGSNISNSTCDACQFWWRDSY